MQTVAPTIYKTGLISEPRAVQVSIQRVGVKMQFNPTDKTIPLQIELKITDDESMMRFDYRF